MQSDSKSNQPSSLLDGASIISFPPSPSTSPSPSFTTQTSSNLPINVIFRKVEESYPIGSDIDVCYTILGELVVTARDWIGLYKVGWRSHSDYVYYDWSPLPEGYSTDHEIQNKVVFSGSRMPQDDGDFYQFCYVSSGGQVRGASTPFQFKVASGDDLVVEEEWGEVGGGEGGLMIVKTRKDLLQDKVKRINSENAAINKKLLSLEGKLELAYGREVEQKKRLDAKMQAEDAMCKLTEERVEQLAEARQQTEYLQGCIAGVQERMDVLNQEKTSMERRLDDSDGYISSLQDKIKALVVEKDLLQGSIHTKEAENAAIKNYNKHLMLEWEEKMRRLKESDMETSVKFVKCDKDLKLMKTSMAYLSDKLQNSEDKLGAAEHCKKMLNEEVVGLKDKLETIEVEREEEIKRTNGEIYVKVAEIEAKEKDIKEKDLQLASIKEQLKDYGVKLGAKLAEEVKKRVESLNGEWEEKAKEVQEKNNEEAERCREAHACDVRELQGSMFALETAHNVLLQKLSQQNKKLQVCDGAKKDLEEKRKEVDFLRGRVHLCAEMYKEKCLENFGKASDAGDRNASFGSFDLGEQQAAEGDSTTVRPLNDKAEMYKKLYWEEYELNDHLKNKLAEQDKQNAELTKKLEQINAPFHVKEEFIEPGPTVICEEEKFVDALNDYSVVMNDGGDKEDDDGDDDDDDGIMRNGRSGMVTDMRSIRSCPFCPVVFEEGASEEAMTSHVERHMDDDVPECPICQRRCPNKEVLIHHTETHFE